jgi:hypothetical protein
MTSLASARTSSNRALTSVLVFWGGYLATVVSARSLPQLVSPAWSRFGWAAVLTAVMFALSLAMLRRERRTLDDVGIGVGPGTVPRFLAGALIGFATYALNVAVVTALVGGITLAPVSGIDWGSAALTLATLLALSALEELGFRGYPLRTLVPRMGAWPAQVLVAVAFAFTHVVYGWPWDTVVFGVLPSAFLFGAAALASGGLAMPIALHAALNAARWALGESGNTGFFTMAIEQSARARIERIAPVTGIAITLAMAGLLWWWQWRAGDRRGSTSAGSARAQELRSP